ncbi:MAG: ATP synthase F1 subunit gamma [Phycisphaerales bacterium]
MAQLREIKKRIKAVKNIQRITNTMQMIATAKFKSSLDRATATKPYTEMVRRLVGELAASAGEIEHPLFKAPEPPAGRELVLVITSDRGLCGAYNANVLRTAMERLRELGDRGVLEVAGKKGVMFFRFAGVDIDHRHTDFGDQPQYDQIEELAERYMRDFVAGRYDRVSVCYMKFFSAGRQKPVVEQLLPLEPPTEADSSEPKANVEYEFSPDPESLLTDLLPITVKTTLFQAFNDAVVSEHVARMVAMKAATDNAGKLSKSLRRTFNRARQAQITTELTEIIGGAASLE